MRAVYIEGFNPNESSIIEGGSAHHLINVLRLKIGSDILILDGVGKTYLVCISQISKGKVFFDITQSVEASRSLLLDLAVGQTKKDALELVLKQACEIGVRKIFILETEFSQRYKLNLERLKKVLIAGIEQSNNPFLPEIELVPLFSVPISNYKGALLLSSRETGPANNMNFGEEALLIVGPEGGFSEKEEVGLLENKNLVLRRFDTHILRTPTAVAVGMGYLFGSEVKA